jgi:chromosome segregation ATPase
MPDTNEEIKELQEEMKEIQNYPIKLSWKNAWIVATTLITIIGSAFGIGMKVQYEGDRIVQLDREQEFKKQIAQKENVIIETERKLKEATEDVIYYSGRYEKIKERLDKCMESNVFFKISENDKSK